MRCGGGPGLNNFADRHLAGVAGRNAVEGRAIACVSLVAMACAHPSTQMRMLLQACNTTVGNYQLSLVANVSVVANRRHRRANKSRM
jgi:hypothetical protein